MDPAFSDCPLMADGGGSGRARSVPTAFHSADRYFAPSDDRKARTWHGLASSKSDQVPTLPRSNANVDSLKAMSTMDREEPSAYYERCEAGGFAGSTFTTDGNAHHQTSKIDTTSLFPRPIALNGLRLVDNVSFFDSNLISSWDDSRCFDEWEGGTCSDAASGAYASDLHSSFQSRGRRPLITANDLIGLLHGRASDCELGGLCDTDAEASAAASTFPTTDVARRDNERQDADGMSEPEWEARRGLPSNVYTMASPSMSLLNQKLDDIHQRPTKIGTSGTFQASTPAAPASPSGSSISIPDIFVSSIETPPDHAKRTSKVGSAHFADSQFTSFAFLSAPGTGTGDSLIDQPRPFHDSSASIYLQGSNDDPPSSSRSTAVSPTTFGSRQWHDRYRELLAYKRKYGDCLVPHNWPVNRPLAQWVKRQRYQFKLKASGKHSTLTDDREQTLREIGFVWDSHATAWYERLADLRQFYQKHGHSAVGPPSTSSSVRRVDGQECDGGVCSSEEKKRNFILRTWCKCQRRQHRLFHEGKKSYMTEERIAKLNELDFVWSTR